jgi:cyclopropane-fatty-acyl-phospholipid synthase
MSSPADSFEQLVTPESIGPVQRALRKQLFASFSGLQGGSLTIIDPEAQQIFGDTKTNSLRATIRVHDADFYWQVAANGSVGAAEAYMQGLWECDDLVSMMRLLLINRERLDSMETGMAKVGGWLMSMAHAFRRNTKTGSRKNIAAHYDLSNELFSLFLCDNLMYSSAMFKTEDESLESASNRKLQRICEKLDLKPSDHLIEIGTGWGGMAIYAARHYGCKVTTTTISQEQHALAAQRIQAAGLSDQITLLLEDYRDLTGTYDKLVSIEMIEAIGHQYLDTYTAKCASLLKPDGLGLIQAITIEDHRYEYALNSVDFIKKHIFPGSFIPCVSAITDSAARTDMRLTHLEDFGPSYAQTLHHWRQRFMCKLDEVKALGFDQRFIRMWDYYLCYCEAGFIERSIGVSHLMFAKSNNRRISYLPGLQ